MKAIVTEWSQVSNDDARDLVNAAQAPLKGNQNDVRELCNTWKVQLREKKRYRSMDTLTQELKMALTQRAEKLKMENAASDRDAATETPRSSSQVAKESTATEHASVELCIETALEETLC